MLNWLSIHHLCSNCQLWSWTLDSDWKNDIIITVGLNEDSHCSSTLGGNQLTWLEFLIRILLDSYHWRFSGDVQLVRDVGIDQNTLKRLCSWKTLLFSPKVLLCGNWTCLRVLEDVLPLTQQTWLHCKQVISTVLIFDLRHFNSWSQFDTRRSGRTPRD